MGIVVGVVLAVAVVAVVGTGGVAAVAIGAGIAAAGAGGGLAGAYIGELIPTSPRGAIATGAPLVLIGGQPAAPAVLDVSPCSGAIPWSCSRTRRPCRPSRRDRRPSSSIRCRQPEERQDHLRGGHLSRLQDRDHWRRDGDDAAGRVGGAWMAQHHALGRHDRRHDRRDRRRGMPCSDGGRLLVALAAD